MAEYIDREAALNAICKDCNKPHPSEKELCPYKFTGCTEYYNVFDVPAADVRPVVHGKWVYDDETGEIYCSKCGRTTNDRHDEIQEFEGKKVLALCYPRYCGFCGADMRVVTDDA